MFFSILIKFIFEVSKVNKILQLDNNKLTNEILFIWKNKSYIKKCREKQIKMIKIFYFAKNKWKRKSIFYL